MPSEAAGEEQGAMRRRDGQAEGTIFARASHGGRSGHRGVVSDRVSNRQYCTMYHERSVMSAPLSHRHQQLGIMIARGGLARLVLFVMYP